MMKAKGQKDSETRKGKERKGKKKQNNKLKVYFHAL